MGNRNWSAEEIDYLESRWGVVSIKSIAKHLNRSINAVKLKANRIGLQDARFSGDVITVNQLSKALNLDYKTVRKWIDLYSFPSKQKIFTKTKKTLVVSYDDFWQWAEENKQRINFARMEPNILGPEPDWVKEKRKADFMSRNREFGKKWTKWEEDNLKDLVNSYRYTYPEIAKMLNRSEAAIKRKLYDLGIKARPIRFDNQVKWTSEQVQMLVTLYEKGYGIDTIAEKVRKSAHGCRGKLERMGIQSGEKRMVNNYRAFKEGKA